MSRRREINNNAQRRFRQRQRDRLQTLEDKLADATRRMEGMKLQMANQETQLQRYSDTQVGVAGICNIIMDATNRLLVTGSMRGWLGADGGHRAAAGPFSHPPFRDPGGPVRQLLTLM